MESDGGPPGKSHLVQAIGCHAIKMGFDVLYRSWPWAGRLSTRL